MLSTIPTEEKARLIALGSEGIKREIAEGKHCAPTSPYRDAVDWLLASVEASENSAALARAEAQDDMSLSISRKALRNSHWANVIAIIAAIIAVIAIVLQK